jgi:hypothetical protein
VFEWRPFERMVTQGLMPIPIKNTYALVEYKLEPVEGGTRLTQAFSKASGPWLGRLMSDTMMPMSAKQAQKDLEKFKQHLEADLAQKRGGLPAVTAVTPEMIGSAVAASVRAPEGADAA